MKFRYENIGNELHTVWTLTDGTVYRNPKSLKEIQIDIENKLKALKEDLKEIKISIGAAAGCY